MKLFYRSYRLKWKELTLRLSSFRSLERAYPDLQAKRDVKLVSATYFPNQQSVKERLISALFD